MIVEDMEFRINLYFAVERNEVPVDIVLELHDYNVRPLLSQGINDLRLWSQRGGNELLNIDLSNYGMNETMS